jgi:hypothetical protein
MSPAGSRQQESILRCTHGSFLAGRCWISPACLPRLAKIAPSMKSLPNQAVLPTAGSSRLPGCTCWAGFAELGSLRKSMKQRFHIRSYDSRPTDLAGEMRDWPEFVSGLGCSVHLRDAATGAEVSVRMTEPKNDFSTVIVEGTYRSSILDRALGRVVLALSEHSDDLAIHKEPIAEPLRRANRRQPARSS